MRLTGKDTVSFDVIATEHDDAMTHRMVGALNASDATDALDDGADTLDTYLCRVRLGNLPQLPVGCVNNAYLFVVLGWLLLLRWWCCGGDARDDRSISRGTLDGCHQVRRLAFGAC